MEQVSNLIIQKLETLAEDEDWYSLRLKHKAITALLPYAVWQERDGRPEMLDAFLHAARASRERQFAWDHIRVIAITLLCEASPRAVILVAPHFPWDWWESWGDLVEQWAATASVLPYSEEIGQSVVDVLLQIASVSELVPAIPVDVWSWLTKRPPLPPICLGRYVGTSSRVVKVVRALKDAEVLKSYLLVVWSEWGDLRDSSALNEMCTSIREDFGGIEMGRHRAELIQQLDHVLGQLDRGLGRLKQHNPELGQYDLWKMKRRYRKLREVLLEVERRAPFSITASSVY